MRSETMKRWKRSSSIALIGVALAGSYPAFSEEVNDEENSDTPALVDESGQILGTASERGEKLASTVGPTFYLDLDFGKKAVNLTPWSGSPGPGATLQMDQHRDGFKVTRFWNLEGGVSPEIVWYFSDVADGLKEILYYQVGLLPYFGKGAVSEFFVKERSQIRTAKTPKLPYNADEVDAWTVGDRVTVETKGGLVFMAGLGLDRWANLGAMITAGGEWKTTVEKSDDNTVLVKIGETKVNKLTAHVGNVATRLSSTLFKNQSEAFSYSFDLRSIRARLAFEDYMRGNLYAIQKLVKDGNLPDVKYVSKMASQEVGKSLNFFFGIPILWNYEWGASRIQNFTTEKHFVEGWSINANYGIYYKERQTKAFFTHRNTAETFFGSAYDYSEKNISNFDGHYGEYYFKYAADDSNSGYLRAAVREVIAKTGLRQLSVDVPQIRDLKNAELELRMMIPKKQTDRLMSASTSWSKGSFIDAGMQRYGAYFGTTDLYAPKGPISDVDGICEEYGRDYSICGSRQGWDTYHALGSMYSALQKMRASVGNDKAFSRAYAEFGKAMIATQFTFQHGLSLIGEGAKLTYRIQGERLSRYEYNFLTSGQGARLQLVNSRPGGPNTASGL